MRNQDHGTILVVEDEPELRFILAAHLRAAGFEVIDAREGKQAVDLCIRHHPDLVIMDIGLPGMDGLTATRKIKAQPETADIPIIILTARTSSDDVVAGLSAGAQEYLAKPFDVAELLARVQTVHRLSIAAKRLDHLNSRLEAEVDAKTRRLQLLYDYTRGLSAANSREDIHDRVMQCVTETIGARRISLFLLNAAGSHLYCARAVGMSAKKVAPLDVKRLEGITGRVYQSGTAFAARAYGASREIDRNYEREAFMSAPLISASLKTEDGVIGLLNVTDKQDDREFSPDEVDCVRSIADAAAIALANITRRDQLQRSVRSLLDTVGRLAEFRDEETTAHLRRVSQFAAIIAREASQDESFSEQITDAFIDSLVQTAPLHDIGKVGIPDDILTKPGKLTAEEFNIMKTHADIGRRVLSEAIDPENPVPLLQMCSEIAHCHHERYNGKGYPRGIAGNKIPLAARIVALVDAYDAITSERRYKSAQPHEKAVEIIHCEAGEHFDPGLVDAFLRCQAQFDKIRARHREPVLALAAASA